MNRYRVMVLPNPGHDWERPASTWPWVIFIRDTINPLASDWTFARTRTEADNEAQTLRTALEEKGTLCQ